MKKALPIIIGALILATGVWFAITSSTNNTSSNPTGGSSTSSSSTTSTSTDTATSTSTSASGAISQAELAKNNGKNGSKCWVAVNGTVYDVSSSREWRNGQHPASDGVAFCGADMSDVIGQAPHGSGVLGELPKIGTLK